MKKLKKILITGAFGGLGISLIDILLESDWYIFACDINPIIPEKYRNHPQITSLNLDVRDTDAIEESYKKISNKTDQLDAIVHTAGILEVGSMVEIPIEKIQRILAINLLGVYQINKTFLPLIIESKGRIIIMSSETGKQTSAPFNGAYALSKHALEAYTDALRRELLFYNIKVIKFQPGAFKTTMTKQVENLFMNAEKDSVLFKKNIAKGSNYLPKVYKNANDPKILAEIIVKALTAKNPKTSYAVKQDSLRNILEYLPVKWADKLIKRVLS